MAFRDPGVVAGLLAAALTAITPVHAQTSAKTAYPGGIWDPGNARYGTISIDDIPVKMDDGTILRARITYPAEIKTGKKAVGRFPVIIENTPYVESGSPKTLFTEHGYIFAKVHARGTSEPGGKNKSEGNIQFMTDLDGRDAATLVKWAAQLEGSDGRVGMMGCSWPGAIALGGAAYVGPNSPLKAVVASCIGLDSLANEAFVYGGFGVQTNLLLPMVGRYAIGGTNDASAAFFDRMVLDILNGGDWAYDRAGWKDRVPLKWAPHIVQNNVPVLLWVGYEDILTEGAFHTYSAFQNAAQKRPITAAMSPKQPVDPRFQLIVGPWVHGRGLDNGIMLQWFETWLKGNKTGIEATKTPMHLYEVGTNRWINASHYPFVANYTSWYLGENGTLGSKVAATEGQDKLSWALPTAEDGRIGYTTPVLESGLSLSGPISATIYASSSNTNMELVPVLYDVGPDGAEKEITRGVVLGSQRKLDSEKSWTDAEGKPTRPWSEGVEDVYLTPGQIYRFDILLLPRQAGVAPGHRLRLTLTTQAPEEYCLKPDKRVDPCLLTAQQRQTLPNGKYSIVHSAKYPSALNLPQMKWNAFPTAASGVTPTSGGVSLPQQWGKISDELPAK